MPPCATHPARTFRWLALNRLHLHHGHRPKTLRPHMGAFCLARNAAVQLAEPREFTRRT